MRLAHHAAVLAVLAALAGPATVARAADPVIAAAGDIACGPAETGIFPCQQQATADLLNFIHPNAVLALGDNQYNTGSLPDYNSFYDPTWGALKAITHPVVGNHDFNGAATPDGYFDYYNGVGKSTGPAGRRPDGWYSFDVGAWHLIALNSNCAKVDCSAGSTQEKWLKADLKAHPTPCTLVFTHAPLWATPAFATPDLQPMFQDIYDANVEMFLVAHDHLYERYAPSDPSATPDETNGVQQIIVGTGGRDLSGLGARPANSEVVDNDTFGVLKLTLHPTSYDWQFMPTAGGGFTDFGSRACHGNGAPPVAAPPPPAPSAPPPAASALNPNAPAASPPEADEDADSTAINTLLSVASTSRSRTRLTIRGRLTTGASAGLLRVTVSRRMSRRTVRAYGRARGGRSGSWRTVVTLPRSLRAIKKLRLTVRYLGETGYGPTSVGVVVRTRARR
jgi:Calcineurin-like phosphoesterase